MSLLAARKKDWTLTKEAFERLLVSLDANRDDAGQKYEVLRRKLVEFFGARGSSSPSDLADETINRVARKMGEGESIQDLHRYCYGVARLLFMETVRAREKEPIGLDPATTPAAPDDEEDLRRNDERERRLECLETCLNKLSPADHAFIVEYYREEKGVKIEHRKRQAGALNVSLNALRLRASRMRSALADCIESCVTRSRETRKE